MTPADTAPDELALPAFEDALWAALRAEHVHCGAKAGTSFPSAFPSASTADDVGGSLSAVDPVARARRRRIPQRALVAAAITLVVGLGIVAATGPGEPVTTGPSAAPVEDVPLTIEARAATAMLARVDTMVVYERTPGSSVTVVWTFDGRTGTVRRTWTTADDRVLAEQGSTRPPGSVGGPVQMTVDHCARAVYPASDLPENPLRELASGLRSGVWAADGTEVVDGRRLVRLRSWPLGIPGGVDGAAPGGRPRPDQWDPTMALYLDPDSLLPVLERHRIGQDDEMRITYTLVDAADLPPGPLVSVPDDYERRPGAEWVEPTTDPGTC